MSNLTKKDMQRLTASFTQRATYFRDENLPREAMLEFFEKDRPVCLEHANCNDCHACKDANGKYNPDWVKCAHRDRLVWWINWLPFHEFDPNIFEWARERFDANIKMKPYDDTCARNIETETKPTYKDIKTDYFHDSTVSAMRLASEFVKYGT